MNTKVGLSVQTAVVGTFAVIVMEMLEKGHDMVSFLDDFRVWEDSEEVRRQS